MPFPAARRVATVLALVTLAAAPLAAAPPEHGVGPYERLILRGVTLVDGTGAPARGPVDVVIEGDRIAAVVSVGAPGAPIDPEARPEAGPGDRELELDGAWVLPGFVDLYAYAGGHREYAWKLWLAHGVTTVREPICIQGVAACLDLAAASRAGDVVAPTIVPWVHFGVGAEGPLDTAEAARAWVARAAEQGARGIKFRSGTPEVLSAALEEAEARGLPTSCHHDQLHVARVDALDAARHGLDLVEHWYGVPEALMPFGAVQRYPPDHNHADEAARFAAAGRLWAEAMEAAPRGGERWNAVIGELAERGVAMLPTLSLYDANRDFMRARTAEWHAAYTLPALWDHFRPSRTNHAAQHYRWTSADEAAWRDNYRRWMDFLLDYRDAGGRVVVGSDAGFMYSLHGFGYVRELELLQEAGLHPLEILRAATLWSAEELGVGDETGSVEVGKRADLVVVGENPLADLKVLYGTGAVRLDDGGQPVRVGGVAWTIKAGRTYDGERLRQEVREMVQAAKKEAAREELRQPGWEP